MLDLLKELVLLNVSNSIVFILCRCLYVCMYVYGYVFTKLLNNQDKNTRMKLKKKKNDDCPVYVVRYEASQFKSVELKGD